MGGATVGVFITVLSTYIYIGGQLSDLTASRVDKIYYLYY